MKKIVASLALLATLAFGSAAYAGSGHGGAGGHGGGAAAHLARLQPHVAAYLQRCSGSSSATCAAHQAKLTGKLSAFEAKLDQKIASSTSATRTAQLTSIRDQVASLLASLS